MSSRNTNTLNRQAWEQTEFPMLCETCLGPNPFVRMVKHHLGQECHVCERPNTIFRWHTGQGGRYKKTVICQTCAKLKNICQSCMLDLEYGVPVEVRDRLLNQEVKMPQSSVNKEYYIQNQERAIANAEAAGDFGKQLELPSSRSGGDVSLADEAGGGAVARGGSSSGGPGGKITAGRAILEKLKNRQPYYERNRARVCTFWAKGNCTRGERCPYRHEMPKNPDGPLAKQTMKDRYYGNNDPVAAKMLSRFGAPRELQAPSDPTITTVFLAGVDESVGEPQIKNVFYQYGEIKRVTVPPGKGVAFVEYTSRDAAQRAIDGTHGTATIEGVSVKVSWGRSRALDAAAGDEGKPLAVPKLKGMPGAIPLPPGMSLPPGMAMPPGMSVPVAARQAYPSMDPSRVGSRGEAPKHT